MNSATFSAMSRLILFRHQKLILISRMNNSKLANNVSSSHFLMAKRAESSSSTSGSPTTRFGTGEFGHPPPTPKDMTIQGLPPNETPGPDEHPFSYSPVYRKSRFAWLFGDGWRRPPAKDQGQRMRRDWFNYGLHPTDEYLDWKWTHYSLFWFITVFMCGSAFFFIFKPDWPQAREWATREAYIEMARREKYGLPYISKDYIDPAKVQAILPSDEELGDFEIVI